MPKRLVECLQQLGQIPDVSLKQLNVRDQQTLVETLTDWRVQPNGTEGIVPLKSRWAALIPMSFHRARWKHVKCRDSIYRRSDGRYRLVGGL
ncbi:hypothetical protein ACNKHK_22555 [Shigella flexneri]